MDNRYFCSRSWENSIKGIVASLEYPIIKEDNRLELPLIISRDETDKMEHKRNIPLSHGDSSGGAIGSEGVSEDWAAWNELAILREVVSCICNVLGIVFWCLVFLALSCSNGEFEGLFENVIKIFVEVGSHVIGNIDVQIKELVDLEQSVEFKVELEVHCRVLILGG